MGTGKLWAFTLAVSAILGQAARGDDASPSSNGSWLSRWFKLGKSSGPNDLDHHHHFHPTSASPSMASMPAPISDEQAQAQAAWNRRMAACLKLHSIASATNDDALRQKAELLDQLIWQQYLQRTAHLPGGPAVSGAAVGTNSIPVPVKEN